MIGTSAGLLEFQALLILKSFATHVLPGRVMNFPRSFCDIVGMIHGGIMIGVKLRRSRSMPLTAGQVRKVFEFDISLMNACCPHRPVRLELWIAIAEGQWQFFEISGDDVREVTHACPP
jgi:hypothetical protein